MKYGASHWVRQALRSNGGHVISMTSSNTTIELSNCNLFLRTLFDFQQELVEINWILFVNLPVKEIDRVNIIYGRKAGMALISYYSVVRPQWEEGKRNWEKLVGKGQEIREIQKKRKNKEKRNRLSSKKVSLCLTPE